MHLKKSLNFPSRTGSKTDLNRYMACLILTKMLNSLLFSMKYNFYQFSIPLLKTKDKKDRSSNTIYLISEFKKHIIKQIDGG